MKIQIRVYSEDIHLEQEQTIEIPDWAKHFNVCFDERCPDVKIPCSVLSIPLSRPKVKKWRWVVSAISDIVMTGYLTEEDVKAYYPNRPWYHKIPETEVEV